MPREITKELIRKAYNGASIISFYQAAMKYMRFLQDNVIDESSAPKLIEILMDLYMQGSKLPRDENTYFNSDRPIVDSVIHWRGNNSIRFRYSPLYWGCLNPFRDEVFDHQLSLSADLGDIADEMMKGIREYENKNSNKALGIWRDGWRLHWGQHAVAAIRVLHWMITDIDCLKEKLKGIETMNDINSYILRFVNSKDIRKHLGKIGYVFSNLEAAWLVWQSRNSTLDERHNAWKQIIAKYPDRPIPERMNTMPQPSLHRFLEEYMDMENRLLKHFQDPTGAVYQVEYCFYDAEPVKESRVYSRFEPEKMSFVLTDEDDVKSVRCIRLPVNGADESALHMVFSVRLDAQKRIIEVDLDPGFLEGRDKELKMDVFGGFWFDFPTPFQKGDILWDPNKADGFCGGPFVCTGINLHEKGFEYMYRDADDSDMTARGLFVSAECGVYSECMSNYMNCEYYPKELAGIRKLLTPFSAYEKGEIDAELLLHACRYIMLDTEKSHTGLHWYTAETLKKAGIMIQ